MNDYLKKIDKRDNANSLTYLGVMEDGTYFIYPLNDADIQFTAALNLRGYYDPDRRIWVLYEAIRGTITANYYVNILDDYE